MRKTITANFSSKIVNRFKTDKTSIKVIFYKTKLRIRQMGFICVHIAQRVCIIGYCPCILRRTGRKAMVKGRGGGGGGGAGGISGGGAQVRGALFKWRAIRPTLLRGRLATANMLLVVYLRAHGQISVSYHPIQLWQGRG